MRTARPLLGLTLTALVLGACTTRDETRSVSSGARYTSLDALLDEGRGHSRTTAPARRATPMAVLPDWIGRPVRLQEHSEADTFEQAVSLSLTPHGVAEENTILLRLHRDGAGADTPDGQLGSNARPTAAGIRSELASAFPGAEMKVVTHPASNAYGPYGLAVGRVPGGARCLYAWQWISKTPELDAASQQFGAASLRVRLCRADITLEAMAAAMNQIKLIPRYEGTAVSTSSARHHAKRNSHRSPRTRPPVIPEAVPGGLEVKPSAGLDRTATPAGRRYLGDPDATASDGSRSREIGLGPAVLSRTLSGPSPVTSTEAITADLPPEALRGPVARVAARP